MQRVPTRNSSQHKSSRQSTSSTSSDPVASANRRYSNLSMPDKSPDAHIIEVQDTISRRSSSSTLPPRIDTKPKKSHRPHIGLSEETKEKHARRSLKYGNRVQHGVENTALAGAWTGGRLGGAAAVLCTYAQSKRMWPAGNFVGSTLVGGSAYAVGSGAGVLAGGPVAALAGKHWLKKHGKEYESYDWPLREEPPMEKALPGKRWKYSIPERMHHSATKAKAGDA